ncbi:hypothetical protein ACFSVM_20375 [Paenibacillus shunpengii]|uniref:Uncharacterized protein n=1 Tax=Paenibacillus shunpengii TaxID=2054424 RepID=A0ABW5SW27_9BACL
MRESEKTIKVTRATEINVPVAFEALEEIYESKPQSRIDVRIAYYDGTGGVLQSFNVTISGEHYHLLMSESPEFAPGKPANEYREIDLWKIIDQLSEEV